MAADGVIGGWADSCYRLLLLLLLQGRCEAQAVDEDGGEGGAWRLAWRGNCFWTDEMVLRLVLGGRTHPLSRYTRRPVRQTKRG